MTVQNVAMVVARGAADAAQNQPIASVTQIAARNTRSASHQSATAAAREAIARDRSKPRRARDRRALSVVDGERADAMSDVQQTDQMNVALPVVALLASTGLWMGALG
jgi:hypothetical protein